MAQFGTATAALSTVESAVVPRVRESGFGDYDQIAALLARNGMTPRARDVWTSLWKGNPAWESYPGQWPIGWVLEADGRVVGSVANVPYLYSWRGKAIRATAECDWAVDKDYRGYSLALLQRLNRQPGVDLLLTTTVGSSSEHSYAALGWSKVPVGSWNCAGYWISGYNGFVKSACRRASLPFSGCLQYPMGVALYMRDRLRQGPRRSVQLRVEWQRDFDSTFDSFWRELRDKKPQRLLGIRDAATLVWHFHPGGSRQRSWITTVCNGSRFIAYAVFIRHDQHRFALKRVRLVDFQALEAATEALGSIIVSALERCRAEGIHVVEDIGCLADRLGVPAPYHRRLESWAYYYRATDESLREALSTPKAWEPTAFDGDLSL